MTASGLGVAVIGCGYWGANLQRNFALGRGWELRWVCDIDPERADASAASYGTRPTTQLDEVLGDPEVIAVALATPPATHRSLAVAALAAEKHVLVEKPLAPSLAEAESLAAEARDSGLVVMCDHTYCYTPTVDAIHQLLSKGELGSLLYVDSVRVNLGVVRPDVDVFWDLAYHDLAILDLLLADEPGPVDVSARGADPIRAGRACMGYVTLTLGNGAIAHMAVNWLSPVKTRRITVAGATRMAVWDDLDPAERLRVYDRGVALDPEPSADERHRSLVSYRLGDVVAPELTEVEPLERVVEEFRTAIVDGRAPLTDAESGLRVVRLLDAVTASQADGGRPIAIGGYR